MTNAPMFFSSLFFFSSFIYCIFGFYILYMNPRKPINRIFFALCTFVFIWCFGFSIANTAPDEVTWLFWRRVSAVGWGSVYTVILYYALILTGTKSLFRKWWSYLLALPGVVTIYIFALSDWHASIQYRSGKTLYGWTNITTNNFWDIFFYIYYIGYMAISLGLLIRWKSKTGDPNKKKQANIILFSFLAALLAGTVTDIIGNTVLSLNIPQMAPIVLLFPIIAIYYSIRKYMFMNVKPVKDEELILNDVNRNKIYKYISLSFIAGGFINFASQYLFYKSADLIDVLVWSIVILVVGIAVKVLQHSKLSENTRSYFLMAAIAIIIPLFTLRFIRYGGITIWAFPFIFVTISLLLNKQILLVFIAASFLATQILIWMYAPHITVTVDGSDYLTRIGLFAINICLAYFISKIYLARLKENANQTRFQKLISDISSGFVTIGMTNQDERINFALKKCGEYFGMDRTCMVVFDFKNGIMTCDHEWRERDEIVRKIPFHRSRVDKNVSWIRQLLLNQVVYIGNKGKTSEQDLERIHHIPDNPFQGLLLIPISVNGQVSAFLEFGLLSSSKKWREDDLNLFIILANVFGDALVKINAEKEINYMAYYDPLTHLPNRVLFRDRATQALNLAERMKKELGIVFLDLDSLKTINDMIGHDGGDVLLIKLAEKLMKMVRKSDTVCRFAGDEFLILLNNISEKSDIVKIVEKILRSFEQSFHLKGQEFFVSVSAGIAIYPNDGKDTDTLIKNADVAMHKAKELGNGQYMLCSEKIKDEMDLKLKLTHSLYRALERNELFIQYQPQIDLKAMKVVGMEALLRWTHPEFGLISPAVFIPLAEQTGLIQPIGEWVLKSACCQNKVWQDMGLPKVRIAINLSVQQFRNPNLVHLIDRVLKASELDSRYLELEITESIAILEEGYIISVLDELRQLGVSISIDDFGTEYSSLSRLKILPVDRIKMDMQFVRGIDTNDKDRAIADVVINLAKKLGLGVIAEGVETETQFAYLAERLCDEVQGYYFYRPLSSERMEEVLRIN